MLATEAPPDYVFDRYIATFAGVSQGTIADASVPGARVTAVGQEVSFWPKGMLGWVQTPFAVRVVRLSPEAGTLAVQTVPGHPLVGWRFWRVTQIAPGQLEIETGAYDRASWGPYVWLPIGPVPSPIPFLTIHNNVIGYYMFPDIQLRMWAEYLNYIRGDLNAVALDASLVDGVWDDTRRNYVMTHVCGAKPGPGGFCQ